MERSRILEDKDEIATCEKPEYGLGFTTSSAVEGATAAAAVQDQKDKLRLRLCGEAGTIRTR